MGTGVGAGVGAGVGVGVIVIPPPPLVTGEVDIGISGRLFPPAGHLVATSESICALIQAMT